MPGRTPKRTAAGSAAVVFGAWILGLCGTLLTEVYAVAERNAPTLLPTLLHGNVPTEADFGQDGVHVVSGQTYVILSHACITCDAGVSLQFRPHSVCTVSNATLPKPFEDRWGVHSRHIARVENGNIPVGKHQHADTLLVPFTHLNTAMHNLYHSLTPGVRDILPGLHYFRPTLVVFRQNIPSNKRSGTATLVERLMAMAVSSASERVTRLNGTVCAHRLVLQTFNYTKQEKVAILAASRVREVASGTPDSPLPDVSIRAMHDIVSSHPVVVIIQRRSSRFILNCDALLDAMKQLTVHASVLALEDFDLTSQLRLMRGVTTLIGAHGAGLAWSHLMRADGLVVELSPFPCIHHNAPDGREGHHSTFKNAANYRLVPSTNFTLAKYCDASRAKDPEPDPRFFDVSTNITTVVDIVRQMDPVLKTYTLL